MKKGTSTSSEDIRTVGRLSLLGLEEGADGIFVRQRDDVIERLITDFPVVTSASSTRSDKIVRPENFQGKSFSDEGSRTSKESIPRHCTKCSEPIDVCAESGESPESPNLRQDLTCKRCAQSREYSAGGSSLPGTPYSAQRTCQSSSFSSSNQHLSLTYPESPTQHPTSSPTKINGNHNYLPYQKHSSDEMQGHAPNSVSTDFKAVSNGAVRTEHVSSKESSIDSLPHRYKDLQYESPFALAKRLYNLEGFGREDVAPELSKA